MSMFRKRDNDQVTRAEFAASFAAMRADLEEIRSITADTIRATATFVAANSRRVGAAEDVVNDHTQQLQELGVEVRSIRGALADHIKGHPTTG